jgi:hypothetical protein
MFDGSPSRSGSLGEISAALKAPPIWIWSFSVIGLYLSGCGHYALLGWPLWCFRLWDPSAAESWGDAYASAELQRQAYIETLVAPGIVEANSKNTMLTPITEDTIMLAKTNTFCYRSGLELQGGANMTKWSALRAFT